MDTPLELIDIGAWIGRQQAFAVIANKCSAAQALALKQVKETRAYEKVGLNWEDFCREFAGISRTHADRIIDQFNEFGDNYFRLSSLARISPDTYREIAAQVDDNAIEIDGQKIALTPENAPKIRAAIHTLHARARVARDRHLPQITELAVRLDMFFTDASKLISLTMPTLDREPLKYLMDRAVEKAKRLSRQLEELIHPDR